MPQQNVCDRYLGVERECLEGAFVKREGLRTPVAGVFKVLFISAPVASVAVDISVSM